MSDPLTLEQPLGKAHGIIRDLEARLDKRSEELATATARAEKAEALHEAHCAGQCAPGYACWFGDCRGRPTSMCGVCDAWFCDAHFDHGSPGDGPHQGGR